MYSVELSKRAQKDLRRIDPKPRARIVEALRDDLTSDPPPDNLDVKPLTGASPWLRLRVGDYRIIYRASPTSTSVRLVAQIVHRRDLDDAVSRL